MKFKSNAYRWAALGLVLASWTGAALAQDSTAVTIVTPSAPQSLDPCEISSSGVGKIVSGNVYEALTRMNFESGSVEPLLADSWTQDSENQWTFKLKEGVQFHDGTPLTAADVVYTAERALDPDLGCLVRTAYFAGTDLTATAIDDLTVQFTTAAPSPILPTLLVKLGITSDSTPKAERVNNAVGTGPFQVESADLLERVVMNRFDGYWGKQPVVTQATYVWRSETSVSAAMVATGEADIAFSIAPQDATNPETDKPYLNSETTRLRPSSVLPPFDDIRVREAVNLAIDRQAFLGSLIDDESLIATQLVGPGVNGYNPDLPAWAYDPDRATALLEEARADGVPVDTTIILVGRPGIFPNSNEVIEAIAEMLRSVGLTIEVNLLDVVQQRGVNNKPFDPTRPVNLMIDQHDNNTGDASFTVFNKYDSDGPQSVTADPEVDALIEQAAAATGDERSALYQELFRKLREDLIVEVPLFHMVNIMRVGPRIDFTPTRANAAELKLADLRFK